MSQYPPAHGVPEATVERLPGYLRVLLDLDQQGVARVSSTELAEAAGVQPALLRRDLSHFGSYGTRGVGYEVRLLVRTLGGHVGDGATWRVLVVGVGNMGRALASHLEMVGSGFRLVAAVDNDPDVVGSRVGPVVVAGDDRLEELVQATHPRIAIITTPAAAAQQVCDRLLAAGVASILNVAPTTLAVPPWATVRSVDIAQDLHVLAFHEARRTPLGATTEKEFVR